jgi:hypothetical protein
MKPAVFFISFFLYSFSILTEEVEEGEEFEIGER